MLIPVTDARQLPLFEAACAHERVFGSKALAAVQAYGLEDSRVKFFLCMDGDTPTAALYLAGEVLVISAAEHAEVDAVAELVRREGVTEVDTNWEHCRALQEILGGETESSYYMVYAVYILIIAI